MTHSTGPTPHPDVPVPPGWCHWHGNTDPTSRIVIEVNRSSGPPRDQSACEPCRDRHGLTSLGELPDGGHHEHTTARPQQRESQ